MPKTTLLVFKKITPADFASINRGNLGRGGGQAFVDFNIRAVPIEIWDELLEDFKRTSGVSGPSWEGPVQSVGKSDTQTVTIAQRRSTTVAVRSQKLPSLSKAGNRIRAWRPEAGFPAAPPALETAADVPPGLLKDLRVYLFRDTDGTVWAGFTQGPRPNGLEPVLNPLYAGSQGFIRLEDPVEFPPGSASGKVKRSLVKAGTGSASPASDTGEAGATNANGPTTAGALAGAPGSVPIGAPGENDATGEPSGIDHAFTEDQVNEEPATYSFKKVRNRNRKAASSLLKLYNECQISGKTFVFNRADGTPYLEVHHIIPLGAEGADSPHNMVVLSAHIHKMLHHATVMGLDLKKMKDCKLTVVIDGQTYSMSWHPDHAKLVEQYADAESSE